MDTEGLLKLLNENKVDFVIVKRKKDGQENLLHTYRHRPLFTPLLIF